MTRGRAAAARRPYDVVRMPAPKLSDDSRNPLLGIDEPPRFDDIEVAQIILGHSKPDTTLIYAERDLAKARRQKKQLAPNQA